MIKLTKSEINSLIYNYFKQESFIYTGFVFKNEIKDDFKNIRRDITLEKILTYGLQYMYGVDHYKDGKVNVCSGVYSLDKLHLCDVVVKKKKKRKNIEDDLNQNKKNSNLLVEQTNSFCINEKSIKENENSINNEKDEMDKNLNLCTLGTTDAITLQYTVKSLDPCKPCNIVSFKDEYLFLYDNISLTLYIFKFGSFTGIKNLALQKMIYFDDILVMNDGNKLIFYNIFNLKLKSVMHDCKKVLNDGNKFITLNFDGTISFFTRDGVKVNDNIFLLENISSGCICNNFIIIWNEEGKVALTNSKTPNIFYFSHIGKKVLSSSFDTDCLYLLHEDGIGIYNFIDKTEKFIINRKMLGICKTHNFILTFTKNILNVFKDNELINLYDTKKDIYKILLFMDYIILVFQDSIEFYDQNVLLIKSYNCTDNIKDIAINEREICILLETKSPILLNIE